MFALKATLSGHLPPTKDALQQHVLRANFLEVTWVRALQPRPRIPHPAGNGWRIIYDHLVVEWMSQRLAPDELRVLVHCRVQTGCSSGRCPCVRAGLPLTDAWSCDDCENQVYIHQSPDIQDGGDYLSESSDSGLGFIEGEAEVG